MAQSVQGSPFNHSSIRRRCPPNLHVRYGQHWDRVLDTFGYRYAGCTTGQHGSVRATSWRPDLVLAVSETGHPRLYENRCSHNGNRLVRPETGNGVLGVKRSEAIVCDYHGWVVKAEDGTLRRCGHMPFGPKDLEPEDQQCRPSAEPMVWRGLVFELGQDEEAARRSLMRTFSFIEQRAPHLFRFDRYELRLSVRAIQRGGALMSIENYLDIDHVFRHQMSLASLVDCTTYYHEAIDEAVLQWMDPNPDWIDRESDLAKGYHRAGLPVPLPCGAAWLTTEFGFMAEEYPGVLVASQCFPHPDDPLVCDFYHDFYYPPALPERAIKAHQTIFHRTGDEDDEWVGNATDDVRRLIARGLGDRARGYLGAKENYAHWYTNGAERLLNRLEEEA